MEVCLDLDSAEELFISSEDSHHPLLRSGNYENVSRKSQARGQQENDIF